MNKGVNTYSSGLRETPGASIVLYYFLENSSDCGFTSELCALKNKLLIPESHFLGDDDGDLQTDGNSFGRIPTREPDNEEIFRLIGAQLAVIGDRLAAEIEPSFVNNLARQFVAENVPKEEISKHLSQAVQALVRRMPSDMQQERAMLVAAMVLAKQVANKAPSVLQQVFSVTVNFINRNLRDYLNDLEPES
ncbi:BH3-interacting domain death agonist [Elgaria multicarinata webbii]|uniref:BH3-interacting domain death agonist n=1 Tax=Elgaria multicarinata webbii TaxID=159646 RepID=UPI002FCD4221